jgi:hypothetical protein
LRTSSSTMSRWLSLMWPTNSCFVLVMFWQISHWKGKTFQINVKVIWNYFRRLFELSAVT